MSVFRRDRPESEGRVVPVREFGRTILRDTLLNMKPVQVEGRCISEGPLDCVQVIPVFEGEKGTVDIPKGSLPKDQVFQGKSGEDFFIAASERTPHVLLVGLGKRDKFVNEDMRNAVGKGVRLAEKLHEDHVVVTLPLGLNIISVAQAATEAAILAAHHFDFKTKDGTHQVKKVVLRHPYDEKQEAVTWAIERAAMIAGGQNIARIVGGMPSNFAAPYTVADAVEALAKGLNLNVQVFRARRLNKMGMGGIINVGMGSVSPPCMIVLEHKPTGDISDLNKVVVVGKGITFDTGGLGIKPAVNMYNMNHDKSGAAAVLGMMHAISQLDHVHVVGIMTMAENMPSGTAYRPNDVIQIHDGQTVEIVHPDAEGRLVLADGLAYGTKLVPDAIFSVATLTGAIVAAIGSQRIGLFAENDRLASLVEHAGVETGELVHRMPMTGEYDAALKSKVADFAHAKFNANAGGTIGARFLGKFTGEVPFAHLDIAGIIDKDPLPPYLDGFSTGGSTRLLIETVLRLNNTSLK